MPEVKFGPYGGGIGVAVWLNTAETAEDHRRYRSVTISPRRFRDRETGEWRDSSGYFQGDIPILLLALQEAQAYTIRHPPESRKRRPTATVRRRAFATD